MAQGNIPSSLYIQSLQLLDFSELQARYQSLSLAPRADMVLTDAEPLLRAVENILYSLALHPKMKPIFETLGKDTALINKMRPSEAKNMLLEGPHDFIDTTRKKLSIWRKTMERLAQGEDIIIENEQQYISSQSPQLTGLTGASASISSYLSIIQLALMELARIDTKNAFQHTSMLAKIRRCSTLLSDCEIAASFTTAIH